MKKILVSALAFVLIAAMCIVPAFAADGIDTTAELKAALAAANDGDTITIAGDFEITESLSVDKKVVIDGAGFTLTSNASVRKTFQVFADVEFKNITIKNNYRGDARVIETRGGGMTLKLTQATIETVAGINSQPLTFGGHAQTADNFVTAIIKDSTVKAAPSGYAVITFNPVKMTVDNSTLSGYTAIYVKSANNSVGSAGSVFTVTNGSVLYGFNPYSGLTNAFTTIAIEDANITMNIDKTSTVKADSTGDQVQFVVSIRDKYVTPKNIEIVIEGDVQTTAVTAETPLVSGFSTAVDSTIVFPVKFAEQLKEEGINVSVINGVATSVCKEGTHKLNKVAGKAATEDAEGYKEHYACEECVALFEDAEGKKEITDKDSLVIAKLEAKNPENGDNLFALYAAVITMLTSAAVLFVSKKRVQE